MIGGRRNLLVGAAVLVTAMTTSSGVMAAPPTTPPPTLATAAGDSIDLGDDFALPDGAPAGPLAAAPGDGFTDLSGFPNGGQYTFRLVSSPGIESFRPFVQATVDELNTIGGPYFTLAAGQAPPTADPVGYEPPPFEVHIMVSGTSPCGSLGWIGCGGPRQYRQLGGVATWSAGTVWLRPSLDGYSDVVKQEVVNHEVGHTFGLGHYDEEYEGRFQVMKSVVEVDATETGYRSGDRNGLEYKAPPPPANDALTAATPISLTHPVRDANTWFATAAGGTGQPELRSVVSTASNRSVWFRFQARAQDVGRPLVVETSNDGVEDFDTVLGRVVNGSLVASNDNAVGTRASRLVFTPTDTTTVHYFVVDGKARSRGVTQITVRPVGDGFQPLAPRRLVDSRRGVGGFSTPWGPRAERVVRVAGITGVPTAATAVVLDVTAVSPTANGALSVYTDGQPRSGASVVTRRGKATTNQVIVPVGSTDRIRIYNNSPGSTHVLVDVVGYHVSGSGAAFEPVGARRVLDSRNGTGGYRTAWNHNVTRNVTIAGHGGVPANATAVVLNVSALSPPAGGYATMWPAATTRPAATAMSWSARELTSKQVTVKLGSGGRIAVFTSTTGPVHLTADVVGWYGPGASTRYVPMTPVHTFDTRSGLGVGGSYPLQANETRAVTLAAARIPGGARAVNVNIRVENTFTTGSATAWDGAGRRPGTWSLAWGAGASPAHLVTTRIRNGGFSIYNRTSYPSAYGDVVGYYAP